MIVALAATLIYAPDGNDDSASAISGTGRTGGGCDVCHIGPTVESIITVSGIPALFTPSQTYTLTITMVDAFTGGSNSFDMDVDVGTLSSSDPNVNIKSATEAASKGDYTVTSWTVDWTAPASGSSVTFDTWGVNGDDLTTRMDPVDNDIDSSVVIPEFSTILIPIVSILGLITAMSIYRRKRE